MECVEYAGYRNKQGYGRRSYKGRLEYAHRVAYVEHHNLTLDDIADKVVRHTCDNQPCVEPTHLVLGTHQDNMDDKVERGRCSSLPGESNGRAVLSAEDVAHIRACCVKGCKENGVSALARRYGVALGTISMIVNNVTWRP